jgi:hypothetical protein
VLSLKFPFTMATRGHLKIAETHYFASIFFHQNWFQSASTSQYIELESNAFQCWFYVALGLIWGHFSLSQVQHFLAMRGADAPFKPLKQKMAQPTSGNPWCIFWLGAAPKKCSLFYQHFSNENMCLGPKQDMFSLFEA